MSAYYYDCEFLEGTQKERFPINLFRKNTPPTIDLISIGLVAEDGREYYAISKDFNLKEAWNRYDVAPQTQFEKQNGFEGRKVYWIRDNVLKPIWIDLFLNYEAEFTFLKGKAYDAFEVELNNGKHNEYFTLKSVTALIKRYGKSNKQIAQEIKEFVYTTSQINDPECIANWEQVKHKFPVNLYGYYSSYDHVCLSWLFGKMIDLPTGFPMYTRDLKQMMDEKAKDVVKGLCFGNNEDEVDAMANRSVQGQVEGFKTFPDYPKQENEHSAIHDARFNKKLHEFLKSLN